MSSFNKNRNVASLRLFAGLGLLAVCAGCAGTGHPPSVALRAPDAQEEVFATPEQAVEALVDASRSGNKAGVIKILGPKAEKLVHSGDKVADKRGTEKFLAAYDKAHKIEDGEYGRKILVVGEEEWPMPIPLVQAPNGWWFDTDTGDDEILNRRIGRNELNVMEVCRTYIDAQNEFADQHPVGKHGHEFAEHFISSDGKHDGLYWPVKEGEPDSPLGPLMAKATMQGYFDPANPHKHEHAPYHGYYYKTLTKQGPDAGGGARDYIVKGKMTGGFALVAWPARYGDSGVMTFIVNKHGIVYQKNLGSHSASIASHMVSFDPDATWSVVE